MQPQEFQKILESAIEEVMDRKLDEWLNRLEDDGELRPEIGGQLLRLRRERQEGKRGTSLAAVAEELELDILNAK
jgi:hypothetical protein